jgi:hypothetical protein
MYPHTYIHVHTHASRGVAQVFWDLDDEGNELLGCVEKTWLQRKRSY